jgi:hypothetical protein
MKKILLPAALFTCALFLYNCTGDDASVLDTTNEAFDSLQPGDTVTFPIDSIEIPVDTVWVPVDSIYIPGDSTVTDTIIVYPYPVDPVDTVSTPVDSVSAGRLAYPRQQYLNRKN